MKLPFWWVQFLVWLLILPGQAQQQFGKDFEAAGAWQKRFEGKYSFPKIRPNWIDDGDRFWYQRNVPGQKNQAILIDCNSGTRTPGFVPAKIISGGFLEEKRSSQGGGKEISLAVSNRTSVLLELLWVDLDGDLKSYGDIPAGQSRDQHTYARHVWLIRDRKGDRSVFFEGSEEVKTVEINDADLKTRVRESRSPDGKWEVIFKSHNVLLRDLTTEPATEIALTKDGSEGNRYISPIWWAQDSGKFVVRKEKSPPRRKVTLVESAPKDGGQPVLHSFDYVKPGDEIASSRPHLFRLDAEGFREIPVDNELFKTPWSLSDFLWMPDSQAFTFLYNQRGHQILRVISVDVESGKSRVIIEETSPTFIDYAGKYFSQHQPVGNEWIWMSERDGWNHLYLYDGATGTVKNQITSGKWVIRAVDWVDEARRQIWFRAGGFFPDQDPYHIHYGRVDFDGKNLVMLTEGDGTHSVEFSPDRRFLIDTWSRVDQPPVIELRRAEDDRKICELERGDVSAMRSAGWSPPERFVAPGRDGKTLIYGVIYRPMDFDPQKRYPVIEKIYAGPHAAFVPKEFAVYQSPRRLAELGFILVEIDGMGTSHRSKAFHDVAWKNLKDSGFPDRIAWLQAAARKYPYLDLSRVGIYGGSAGGQSTMAALLWHGDFYKVGVADCGCHDNRMDKIWWNELWMGWPVDKSYQDNSNVANAHRLQGKLLLTVGELDRNVDPASTMQVVDALIKADKDFDMIVVPGAGHGVGESPYLQKRRADFFLRHLAN